MSDTAAVAFAGEPGGGYSDQIMRAAEALAAIGTPEAIAAIEALAVAHTGLARAFERAAATIQSAQPTEH